MRDWIRTLPRASFRGAEFYAEQEDLQNAGRRVAEHDYAKSEDHSTEDMGRNTRRFRFDAYVASDTADTDAQALIELCSQPGDGELVLQMLGRYTVKCTEASASAANTGKLGYVKLTLAFVESGNNGAFSVVALGDRIAASLQDGMTGAVGTALNAFAG